MEAGEGSEKTASIPTPFPFSLLPPALRIPHSALPKIMPVDTLPIAAGQSFVGLAARWGKGPLFLWLAFCGLLFWRRISGELREPLDWRGLVLLAVVWPLLTVFVRVAARWPNSPLSRPNGTWEYACQWLPSLGLALAGVAVTLGANAVGITLLWVAIGSEVILGAAGPRVMWRLRKMRERGQHRGGARPPEVLGADLIFDGEVGLSDVTESPTLESLPAESEEDDLEELPWLWTEPTARQEFRRLIGVDGAETIIGSVRYALNPRQELTWAHVGFCPPLRSAPLVQLDLIEPSAARIKVAQALPHGVRFEIKLPGESNESREVVWSFVAREAGV